MFTVRNIGVLALAAIVVGAGCAPAATTGGAAPSVSGAAFPRTVEWGNHSITIRAQPTRVAALSTDAAEAVLRLVGPERVVAVPDLNENPATVGSADLARQVRNKVPGGAAPDPEKVLSFGPDLVVITTRHGGEQDANALLQRSGIPVLNIDNGWENLDQLRANYRLIARALGAEDRAEQIIADMDSRIARVQARVANARSKPTLLVFSNQGPVPFLLGPGTLAYSLVTLTGATPAVDGLGLRRSQPADIEQVIRADPDYILMIDVFGRGEAGYGMVLNHPGVQALRAVRENRVMIIPSAEFFSAGPNVAIGVEKVAKWIHPEAF